MKVIHLILSAFLYNSICAQVIPADRSILNYRLIGFSVPEQDSVTEYEFVISELVISDRGETIEKPIVRERVKRNLLVSTVPDFDKTYIWRVNYYANAKALGNSETYRFATGYSPFADTSKYRLKILKNKTTNKDLLVFIDGMRTLFDTEGNPLWYLPDIPGITNEYSGVRDLKITPQGSISFLNGSNAYEIDYNGNILWKGPNDGKVSGDSSENYHHELSRLSNGHYMVLGTKNVKREIPDRLLQKIDEKEVRTIVASEKKYTDILFGTIIEYDGQGNVVWSWNSENYLSDDEVFRLAPDGKLRTSTHMNGFFFDEKNQHIFVSYRNINTIQKISYPSGKIIASYKGGYAKTRDTGATFTGQHACKLSTAGQLYLFNNNNDVDIPIQKQASSVDIMSVPKNTSGILKNEWRFYCNIDNNSKNLSVSGGGVYELSSGDILVCMGDVNRNFIVGRNKEVLWNALTEKKDGHQGWIPLTNGYRCYPLQTRNDLEYLIFNSVYADVRHR